MKASNDSVAATLESIAIALRAGQVSSFKLNFDGSQMTVDCKAAPIDPKTVERSRGTRLAEFA